MRYRLLKYVFLRGHQCRIFKKSTKKGQAGHQQSGERTDDQPTTPTQLNQCGDE